jgi:hypothetical protein
LAARSGWAIYPDRSIPRIKAGSFACLGETPEQKADALARNLIALFKREGKPDYCVIEQPQRNVQQYKKAPSKLMPDVEGQFTINAGTALQLNQLVGAAVAICAGFGVPWAVVPVQTWRSAFFPKGMKGKDRQDWKRMAKAHCELVKIPVSNADEAEAVGIAVYGPHVMKFRELELAKEKAA